MLQGVADALQVDLSGAIPGVLPPVTAESDLLVDSGVPKETCPNFGD
jgi:predicted acylesterase/phospholipase RssA